jgi:hypothetical protein
MANGRGECFVLMGFGVKTDYKNNRSLDMEKSYKIIKSAVVAAGLQCIRSNDIVQAGMIDRPIYEHLLTAEVAVADLSTSNENAIYELGVRHALRPHRTIVIAEDKWKFPFDLQGLRILQYRHLESGIDFEEAERLRDELRRTIEAVRAEPRVDSPVYTFLHRLRPPALETPATRSAEAPAGAGAPADVAFTNLLEEFREARRQRDFTRARDRLIELRRHSPDDPYLIQQLAFVTYHIQPVNEASLLEASEILRTLQPRSSGDPETLGLWGAIHKRLWEVTSNRTYLNDSIVAYERGFYMKLDHYTGINLAFMLDQRASLQRDPEERTADRILARRIRQQLLPVIDDRLNALPRDAGGRAQDPHEEYWLNASRLEALLGLRDPRVEPTKALVFERAPEEWMMQATRSQLDKLAALLAPPI